MCYVQVCQSMLYCAEATVACVTPVRTSMSGLIAIVNILNACWVVSLLACACAAPTLLVHPNKPQFGPNIILIFLGEGQFVCLVCSHFKAKEVFHLVKQKHASPLSTFCKVLDKRLTGDQKPIEGEVVEDDMVIVTATVQIVADHSAQTHTSPDATVSAQMTLDQGASKQNCRSEHVLVYADCA